MAAQAVKITFDAKAAARRRPAVRLARVRELVAAADISRRYPDNFEYAAVPLGLWRQILAELDVQEQPR